MKPKIKPDKIRGQKTVSLAFAEDRMHLGIARTAFGSALDLRSALRSTFAIFGFPF